VELKTIIINDIVDTMLRILEHDYKPLSPFRFLPKVIVGLVLHKHSNSGPTINFKSRKLLIVIKISLKFHTHSVTKSERLSPSKVKISLLASVGKTNLVWPFIHSILTDEGIN
jgi:hypothetical protein